MLPSMRGSIGIDCVRHLLRIYVNSICIGGRPRYGCIYDSFARSRTIRRTTLPLTVLIFKAPDACESLLGLSRRFMCSHGKSMMEENFKVLSYLTMNQSIGLPVRSSMWCRGWSLQVCVSISVHEEYKYAIAICISLGSRQGIIPMSPCLQPYGETFDAVHELKHLLG